MEIKFKRVVVLPCINVKSFSIKTPQDTRSPKKWKDVPFPVEEFDFLKYVDSVGLGLDLD